MRKHVLAFMAFLVSASLLVPLVIVTKASIITPSTVYIEPTGYEDPATHAWKGSFWVVAATVDTTESFLFFNKTTSEMFGLNTLNGKTVIPSSQIKVTITAEQPYWEIPLTAKPYNIYPEIYGTDLNYLDPLKTCSKNTPRAVPGLNVTVLESREDNVWDLYTPFSVTLEKSGNDSFSQTVRVNNIGGTDTIVVTNPDASKSSETMMIQNLAKLYTGPGQPTLSPVLIINNKTVFSRTYEVMKAIKYPSWSDDLTPDVDENYALYWFGGGNTYRSGIDKVKCWSDDQSPMHVSARSLLSYNSIVEDGDFPGSERLPDDKGWFDVTTWKHVKPIEASIDKDNPSALDKDGNPGMSLVSYLTSKFRDSARDLSSLYETEWTVTSANKLRIYAPRGSFSSMITIKISTELADSMVYVVPPSNMKFATPCCWSSTNTERSTIRDNDTIFLTAKQEATVFSKGTVQWTVSGNLPVDVNPPMDSIILDPGQEHTFSFNVRNLGTQTKQTGTITFTIKNDLGTVTDTRTFEFDLLPVTPEPPIALEGDPMWILLVTVIAIAGITAGGYLVYSRHSAGKRSKNTVPPTPPPPPQLTPRSRNTQIDNCCIRY